MTPDKTDAGLLACPFCKLSPEAPFENLRDSDDMEEVVKVWTIQHHCDSTNIWVEGKDGNECAERWNALRTSPPSMEMREATIEECAKICRRIAISAERRFADHTNLEAKQAALDKCQAAQECEQAIRALSPEEKQ